MDIMEQTQLTLAELRRKDTDKCVEETPKAAKAAILQDTPEKKTRLLASSGASLRRIDYDLRNNSYLASMRKLFEEFRMSCESGEVQGHEINGDAMFKDHLKHYDGSVRKEDFVYTLLEKDIFSLNRTEVTNLAALMLNISAKQDGGFIDLEELQFSYKSYLKY